MLIILVLTFYVYLTTVVFRGRFKFSVIAKDAFYSRSSTLKLVEFGPSFSKHPMLGRILATEGGNATIACDPDAAPAATISWMKDGNVS